MTQFHPVLQRFRNYRDGIKSNLEQELKQSDCISSFDQNAFVEEKTIDHSSKKATHRFEKSNEEASGSNAEENNSIDKTLSPCQSLVNIVSEGIEKIQSDASTTDTLNKSIVRKKMNRRNSLAEMVQIVSKNISMECVEIRPIEQNHQKDEVYDCSYDGLDGSLGFFYNLNNRRESKIDDFLFTVEEELPELLNDGNFVLEDGLIQFVEDPSRHKLNKKFSDRMRENLMHEEEDLSWHCSYMG